MPTDPLSLVFAGSFLVGLLFLLISSFTGHGGAVHHIGHAPIHLPAIGSHAASAHGGTIHVAGHTTTSGHALQNQGSDSEGFSIFAILNPLTIALFLIGFGFFGFVFYATTALALPTIFLIAALGGLVIATLMLMLLNRIFGGAETTTVQDVSDRTGLLGKVNVTIPQNSIGEIIYISPGGMRKSIPARSVTGQRLERDQEVVVVNYQRGVAEVDTWDHFVNQEDSPSISANGADDLATLRTLLEESDKNTTEYSMQKDSKKE